MWWKSRIGADHSISLAIDDGYRRRDRTLQKQGTDLADALGSVRPRDGRTRRRRVASSILSLEDGLRRHFCSV